MGREKEGEAGLIAVRAAAKLCERVRATWLREDSRSKLDKQDGSPVTIADLGAQALVCRLLGDAFPQDPVVGEEDSAILLAPGGATSMSALMGFVGEQTGQADVETVCGWIDRGKGEPGERYWTLDPIDGTKGFLRNDQYAVALALIENGVVQWGFLACPALPHAGGNGVVFVAQRGAGTRAYDLDGEASGPVQVSDVGEASRIRIAESMEKGHTSQNLSVQLKDALGIAAETMRMDSQAKYGVIARGQADLYLRFPNPKTPDYRENIWDHAAGSIVVEEAGGRVTDAYGRPLDWTRGRKLQENIGIVATNGRLHDVVIEALAPLLRAD